MSVGGPERQFTQRWRLDTSENAKTLPAVKAKTIFEAANSATAAVMAQIAAQQATAKH